MRLEIGDAIRCPECDKEIGVLVLERVDHIPGLGACPVYDQKHDYRKASHIGFGKGLICKSCAKRYFPEGIAYRVTVNYHGKRITPFIGLRQRGLFSTRSEANDAAKDMNRRCKDNYAMIEEVKF